MNTLTDYGQALSELSEPARLAFACGSAEHVLPLAEHLLDSQPIRDAIDAAWGAVLGGQLSRVQEAALTNRVEAIVPNIGSDPTLRAELGMNIGELATDLLECAAGEGSLAERIGVGVLDTLTVALDALRGEDPGEWRRELEDPSKLHPLLREEWDQQAVMLGELADWRDGSAALVWREDQRRRGREVAERLGAK